MVRYIVMYYTDTPAVLTTCNKSLNYYCSHDKIPNAIQFCCEYSEITLLNLLSNICNTFSDTNSSSFTQYYNYYLLSRCGSKGEYLASLIPSLCSVLYESATNSNDDVIIELLWTQNAQRIISHSLSDTARFYKKSMVLHNTSSTINSNGWDTKSHTNTLNKLISGGIYPIDEHSIRHPPPPTSSTSMSVNSHHHSDPSSSSSSSGTSNNNSNNNNNMQLLNTFTNTLIQTTSSIGTNISNMSKLINTAVIHAANTTANSTIANTTNEMILTHHNTSIQVMNTLSEGGYGIVYLAKSTAVSGIRYALKVVTCHDPDANTNALNELNMLKAVINNHPHNNYIIQLLDYSIIHSSHVTVYNYLFPLYNGTCWDQIEEYMNYKNISQDNDANDGRGWETIPWPFPEKIALQIIHGVSSALAYIHQMGYSHRDMKPHNILLEYTSDQIVTPVLMDLGSMCIAKICVTSKKHALSIQELASLHTSPAYRPPELVTVPYTPYMMSLITGNYDDTLMLTESVDMWGLGCVMYALAFGISPFESLKTGMYVYICK